MRSFLPWAFASLAHALAGPAAAQRAAGPGVAARLSTGVVKLGGDVRLVIDVQDAARADVGPLPAVEGLRFGPLGGPSIEEGLSIGGGRRTVTRKLSWAVVIQPLAKGEYVIPPIPVRADGRDLATRELSLKVVEDMQGEELGLFELDAPDQVYEGQPFLVELRFGWDMGIDQAINYANLSLPWLELAGLVPLDAPLPQGTPIQLNLNSRERINAEQLAPQASGERTFRSLRVRRRFLAGRPGRLEFATSHLEFGQVQEGGFFGTRPTERKTYFKRFPGFTLDVLALPEADRPLDFGGAVGTLRATATADRRDVDVGESIKLQVEWTGNGNIEFFEPPDLARVEAFRGFRVYGTTDRKSWDRRVVVYDIAPKSAEVDAIPGVPLSVFDTETRSYATVATDGIAIRVRPLADGAGLAEEPGARAPAYDVRDVQTERVAGGEPPRPGSWTVLAALLAVPAVWLTARTLVRRGGDPDAPIARARRAAPKRLRRELAGARTASAQSRALERFLAALTAEREQAWLGRDPVAWAASRGGALDEARAKELAELFARLDERTWAGRDEPLDAAAVLAVAERAAKGGIA